MNPKLKLIVDSIDFYQATYPEDACILIFDTEKVIGYKRGKVVDLKVTLGESVEKHRNTTSVRAMRSGKFLREERGAELFGFSYIASSVPVYDEGKIIGVVTGVISNNRFTDMRSVATELSGSVQEMSATTDELAHASTHMAKRLEELAIFADSMSSNIQEINSVVNAVKEIAMHSKILGLNASIEAARSGVHGKGFAVVAKEIQKMAQSSTESAENIATQIGSITQAIEYINTATTQIAAVTEQYTASMHEMNDGYSSISDIGKKLIDLSEISH